MASEKKDKKMKKEKKEKKEKDQKPVEVTKMDVDGVVEEEAVPIKRELVPYANPLADSKLTKKLLKAVQKGEHGGLRSSCINRLKF